MSFVSVPGLKGKVYAPDESREGSKKNPCRDCFSCQQCSDDRCRVCLSVGQCCSNRPVRKITECKPKQILLRNTRRPKNTKSQAPNHK